jgi:hypothetical protein
MTKEFREYRRKLNKLAGDEFNKVVAETLNSVATVAHIQQIRNVRERFTLRNQYTERSLKYWKATPKPKLWKINAVIGSISDYMKLQEEGGDKKPKSGSRVAVATLQARGGNRASKIRKKYYAGKLPSNSFVGIPKGVMPVGIWERYQHNKKIRMIRNLEHPTIKILPRHWHRDAVQKYANERWIQDAFVINAKRRLTIK